MADKNIKLGEIQQNSNQNKKKSKKKKLRLKKSVRRTAGALLLVTALIVAAIPVNTAQAAGDGTPDITSIPSLFDIVFGKGNYEVNEENGKLESKSYTFDPTSFWNKMSVSGSGTGVKAIDSETGKRTGPEIKAFYAFPQSEEVSIFEKIGDGSTKKHIVYKVDVDNMDDRRKPVAIYELQRTSVREMVSSQPDCITKYVGGTTSGHTPQPPGHVNLGNNVCYQLGKPVEDTYVEDRSLATDPETQEIYNTYYENRLTVKNTTNNSYAEANPDITEVTKVPFYIYRIDTKKEPVLDDDGNPVLDDEGNPVTNEVQKKVYATYEEEQMSKTDPVKKYDRFYFSERDDDSYESFFVCDTTQTIYSIADEAFMGTANFESIEIPGNIAYVGNLAFHDCSILNSASFGPNCERIGCLAFANCDNLSSITFESNCPLDVIGDGAFAQTAVKTVQLPNSVQKVGNALFYGCESLNDVVKDLMPDDNFKAINSIFNGVTKNSMSLGNYVFAKCTNMTDIHLYSKINSIGTNTFAGDTNLLHAEMPTNFDGTLDKNTFLGCEKLEWVRFEKNYRGEPANRTFVTESNKTDTDLKVTVPNNFAIWGPNPKDSSDIHQYAVKEGNTYMYDVDGVMNYELTLHGYKFIFDSNGIIKKCEPQIDADRDLVVPETIANIVPTTILPGAFKDITTAAGYPKTLTIPSNISEIGDQAFMNCGTIEEIDFITAGVEIGKDAFRNNESLERVSFKQVPGTTGGTKIGDTAFYDCKNLTQIDLLDDDFESDSYDHVMIDYLGIDSFKTNGESLTIKGPMSQGYEPYEKAISGYSINAKTDGYITYITGNPQNLICKYNQKLGGAELVRYPNLTDVVGTEVIETNTTHGAETDARPKSTQTDTITTKYKDVTIHDLMVRYDNNESMYQMQAWICDCLTNMKIPYGIKYIDNAQTEINAFKAHTYTVTETDVTTRKYENPEVEGEPEVLVDISVSKTFAGDCDSLGNLKGGTSIEKGKIPDDKGFDIAAEDNNKVIKGFKDQYDPWLYWDGDDTPSRNCSAMHGIKNLEFESLEYIPVYPDKDKSGKVVPEGAFNNNPILEAVQFNSNLSSIGTLPFYCDDASSSKVTTVNFKGDEETVGTEENPKYWFKDGLIFSSIGDGKEKITTLEECLPGRGNLPSTKPMVASDETEDVNFVAASAFENCDFVTDIDLSNADFLKKINSKAFYDCDKLSTVKLPNTRISIASKVFASEDENTNRLEVTMPAREYDIRDDAFENRKSNSKIYSADDSAAKDYAQEMGIAWEKTSASKIHVYFRDSMNNMQLMDSAYISIDTSVTSDEKPTPETYAGYDFDKWTGYYLDGTRDNIAIDDKLSADTVFVAWYKGTDAPTPTPTGTPTPTTKPSGTPTSSPSGGSSSKSSSSSSSSKSSSSTSTSVSHPIILSGQNATPFTGAANVSSNNSGSGSGSTGTSSKPKGGQGKTSVISTADGITDVGKMSATVNGSSDNYVVKITQTQEATDSALAALQAAFGNIEPIRYLPIDISLYDSTGTNKISPIPEGTSISITMPIPDDLAIYGGNAKVASTVGGVLEKIQPRFTVINSVPCMTYTVTHLSPYVIYVDTANLTEAGISDSTPKTADPIHPKWFLSIGLAAVAILLFLKKDPEEYMKRVKQA